MEHYPQLIPLIILIPSIGAFINFFWGAKLSERGVAIVATTASSLAFLVAVLLYAYLSGSHYQAAVVNPPLLDGWIRLPGVEIPWQLRVDTLSVTMMLVITGVGSLIHLYSIGYLHGDERFSRYFAYLNMFLAFMLVLVTGNNLLMMFVGWEGVGLCSFLLIGFWFDRAKGIGWRNSNAAKKAMILNRIGDFGILMAVFLTFWTFHTVDFFKPGEIAVVHEGETAQTLADKSGEGATTEATTTGEAATTAETHVSEGAATGEIVNTDNTQIQSDQLGIFGQAQRMIAADAMVQLGPFNWPISTVLTLITLFMLLGVTGKSAQIPLFVWLPDAMAGPTPASALIHAATMVTAGVYLMVRSNVFFTNAPLTSLVVTLIGTATALAAGYIALGQWDIKRVLAYSTVSQLGFMVAAVGVGAYGAAIFHLVTHAFFKALLFLGSGSVIHGMEHGHHEAAHHGHGHDEHGHDDEHEEEFDPQDMRNMGGLRHKMPITYWCYVFGTLALAGIFPFAGFWSKDEILASSWLRGLFGDNNNLGGYIALAGLLAAAALTAFYMWRQVVMVFHGDPRTEAADHAPESSAVMTIPLIVLAFFSLFVGFINTPNFILFKSIFGEERFTQWLEQSVLYVKGVEFQPLLALIAFLVALGSMILAGRIYGHNKAVVNHGHDPLEMQPETGALWSFANARMYWDRTYYRLFENPFNVASKFLADTLDWAFWHDWFHNMVLVRGFNAIATFLSKPVDLGLIDGVVNGVGSLARWISGRLRTVQTGYVRTYAVTILLGVVVVIIVLLLPMLNGNG
ncbi:MAG: hypothetical protein GC204_15740 [Chloroflexi bacterium]|nr:hypothetical protein [Chloroflexota bacterium]